MAGTALAVRVCVAHCVFHANNHYFHFSQESLTNPVEQNLQKKCPPAMMSKYQLNICACVAQFYKLYLYRYVG